MKNLRFYLLSLGLFTVVAGNSQIELGFSAGIISNNASITKLSDNLTPNLNNHYGLSIDLDLDYRLSPKWAAYTGLGIAQKGVAIKNGTSLNTGTIDIPLGIEARMRSNNINIPLGIKYIQTISDQVEVYAKAGTSMDYAVNGKIKTIAHTFIDITLTENDINYNSELFDRMTFNGDLALGARFAKASGQLFTELAYRHGFNQIFTDPVLGIGLKPMTYAFKVGYAYNL